MQGDNSKSFLKKVVKMRELSILIVLIAMIFFFSIASNVFFTVNNFLNITRQISLLGIMAMGMTMVIAVGGVDLSVGAVYAICSTSAAALMTDVYKRQLQYAQIHKAFSENPKSVFWN